MLALNAPVAAQTDPVPTGKVTPLFASDATLEITLTGPIGKIARSAERSEAAHDATLAASGETHAVTLAARGISRRKRENCRFPPLRIRFPEKPAENSLFHKQGSIKLVTHCRDSKSYDQIVLREYAIYRLYNVVTPESLKVRLAQITYMDAGKVVAQRPGFLIEDADDAARRLGLKEVDTGNLPVNAINPDDAARYALFQYMIGNTDWAMVVGPDQNDCCHNSKLLGQSKNVRRGLTPVPYDFDNAGLVDAPYAFPNASLGTRSVKQRVYRGFCAHNALIPAEAERAKTLRPTLEAEIRAVPGLSPRVTDTMLRYLAGFYEAVADNKAIEKKLLSDCR